MTLGLAPRNKAFAPSSLTILVPQSRTPLSGFVVHVSVINLVLMTSNGVVTNPVTPPAAAPKAVASTRLTSPSVRPRHLDLVQPRANMTAFEERPAKL